MVIFPSTSRKNTSSPFRFFTFHRLRKQSCFLSSITSRSSSSTRRLSGRWKSSCALSSSLNASTALSHRFSAVLCNIVCQLQIALFIIAKNKKIHFLTRLEAQSWHRSTSRDCNPSLCSTGYGSKMSICQIAGLKPRTRPAAEPQPLQSAQPLMHAHVKI